MARKPWYRAALAVAYAAGALALGACSYSPEEGPLPSEAYQNVPALPVPAVTAPAEGGDEGASVPEIWVSPDPLPSETPASGGGTPTRPEQSVVEATRAYEGRVFALVNDERTKAGLPALEASGCATTAARARADRALPKPQLEHEPLDFSCEHGWAGENLAQHYGPPSAMVDAWMRSAGHRENILRREFTGTGVGCVAYDRNDPDAPATRADRIGGYLCSQVFLG